MKMPEAVKNEKISHLEYCLDKLIQKDNGCNELEIVNLYRRIYHVVCEMKRLDAHKALEYFTDNINDNVRTTLKRLNIELCV